MARPYHRVLCAATGSGPLGEKVPDAKFHLLQHLPPALNLLKSSETGTTTGTATPAVEKPQRHDIDIGPGGLAFIIDNVLSRQEADALVELTESMGYSRYAPNIQTPPGMRQNKACHWFAGPGEPVSGFVSALYQRIKHLLPPTVDPGDRLCSELSHRFAHYKYDDGDVFNKHTDGAWPGQRTNASLDGIEEWGEGNWVESKLSMLLYLSDTDDGVHGGNTRLYRFDGGAPVDVEPRKGSALFFRHGFGPSSVLHSGLQVHGSVPKYVARLNVMYSSE